MFKDLEGQKSATVEEIAEEFESRYYYCTSDNVLEMDDDGHLVSGKGWGASLREPFFGTNSDLLIKLARLEEENNRDSDEIRAKIDAEFKRLFEDKFKDALNLHYVSSKSNISREDWNRTVDEFRAKYWEQFTATPEYKKLEKKRYRKLSAYYHKIDGLRKKVALEDAKAFKSAVGKSFIARFNYSDNDGEFNSNMEHGGIFRKVQHVTISHH